MSEEAEALAEHAENLRLQIEAEERLFRRTRRAELWKRIFIVSTLIVVCALLGLTLWVVSLVRGTQQTGSPVLQGISQQLTQARIAADQAKAAANAARDTNRQIQSCVDPEGKCYREGAKRTASALASINTIVRYSVACSTRIGAGDEPAHAARLIRDCVADLVAAHIKQAGP